MTTVSSSYVRGELFNVRRSGPAYSTVSKKMTPSQAAGIRFEKKVGTYLEILARSLDAKLEKNPWFQYNDMNGPHACSPDFILNYSGLVIVIEVKVTWLPSASAKLKNLYIPIVSRILRPEKIGGIVLCRNLTPEAPQPIQTICSALHRLGTIPAYHWPIETPICF